MSAIIVSTGAESDILAVPDLDPVDDSPTSYGACPARMDFGHPAARNIMCNLPLNSEGYCRFGHRVSEHANDWGDLSELAADALDRNETQAADACLAVFAIPPPVDGDGDDLIEYQANEPVRVTLAMVRVVIARALGVIA